MCLILITSKSFSQQNLQMTKLDNSCDTLVVKTWVWFSFGYQSTCPQLSHFETFANSDTMELKLYYNISGPWPQVGCERTDTITTVMLPNVTTLKGVAFSIFDNDTTMESTTQIQTCSPTGIESFNNDSFSSIFPNPFSTQLHFQVADNTQATVFLFDLFGRQILQQQFTTSTTINTEQLASGAYIYQLRNDKGVVRNGELVKN
jgi:hypothetical protein